MLFFNICLMEKYKKSIFNSIMQILLCIISHFQHEKEQGVKIFSFWSAQDGWKHFPKHQMQVMKKFWKLAISKSSMKYVIGKLNNSFTVSRHFMLVDKLYLTGREFCLLSHPHDESEIWKKQICIILFSLVWEFVKSFHTPNVRK